MLAGALPRLASALLQPPVLAAGLVTGVVGGTVGIGTGAIPVTDVTGAHLTALYECPASARIVTRLAPNQDVLVTARSKDGAWFEIYIGEPGADRGWARATSVQLPSSPDTLPIADCTPSGTAAPQTAPNGEPSAATETPAADAPPTITDLIVAYPNKPDPATGTYVIGTPSRPCSGESAALIDVQVADPDGIAYVGLAWEPFAGSDYDADMEHKGGNLWEAWIEAEDAWSYGPITYLVFARDTTGKSSTLEWSPAQALELRAC